MAIITTRSEILELLGRHLDLLVEHALRRIEAKDLRTPRRMAVNHLRSMRHASDAWLVRLEEIG
jgi:hypothetical protein